MSLGSVCGSWMINTPAISRNSVVHFPTDKLRLRNKAPKTAAVAIFNWYVTWKVAASRLESPIYTREFDKVYSPAGTTSFQLSPVKTAAERLVKSEVAGMEGGTALDIS